MISGLSNKTFTNLSPGEGVSKRIPILSGKSPAIKGTPSFTRSPAFMRDPKIMRRQ